MDCENITDLYTSLFNTIPDPFFIIGEDGTYLEVIGGAERSLYDDASSLKGRNIHDFMEADFAKYFMEQVRKSLDSRSLNCFEYQLATGSVDGIPKNGPGGIQWFEARLYPLVNRYQGQRAVSAMIINITERKTFQQRLRDLSYQDPLTMVANRRFFLERLSEDLAGYMLEKTSISVMILDVDHFKRINDTWGHLAGDHVLKELVLIAKEILHKGMVIARFGGDEFITSIVGMQIEQTVELAEQLRLKVQKHRFVYEGTWIPVTVSIGVSNITAFDTDISSIISRADKALYQAKETGRNRVASG